jgi:hypothetical protein
VQRYDFERTKQKKNRLFFALSSFTRTFGFAPKVLSLNKAKKNLTFLCFVFVYSYLWLCAEGTFAQQSQEKLDFSLLCLRLLVPLQRFSDE